jgi:hypothetical protein
LSARRLGVLVRGLPPTSRLVTALNGGQPKWTLTDHLLADIWVVLVRANSKKGSLPDGFDHPVRVEMKQKTQAAAAMSRLAQSKATYENRKRERASRMNPVVEVSN